MTDKPANNAPVSSDFLIRGSDFLAKTPGFKLVGRDEELKTVSNVLMRRDNNNLVLHGPNGVGISAIVMGLQASKDDLNTPFDIVGKRFFWLDTDALFSSGDAAKINDGFQKALATLSRSKDTVLVIDDMKGFLEGARNSGTTNLINGLMRELGNKSFQAIFECRDDSLQELFKSHSSIGECFTFQEVQEPGKVELRTILESALKGLEEYHGVSISKEAVDTVVDLTLKYPGLTLNTAQPKRSTMILEGALTAFRHKAHTRPAELDVLEERVAAIIAGKKTPALDGKTPEELLAIRADAETRIREVNATWQAKEKAIRSAYADQRSAEEKIREIDDTIVLQKEREEFTKKLADDFRSAKGDADRQKKISEQFFAKYGEALTVVDEAKSETTFSAKLGKIGDSSKVAELKKEKSMWEGAVKENKAKFEKLTKGDEQLVLGGEHVLAEFSRLSNIPMSKLQQDETSKLLSLEATLKERVFGQNEPVIEVSKAVRRGRAGLKKANKPIGSFLFLGPSGVGKTELAKALAASLFGDESALQTYNMSEYMEKHAVSSLIGAPPGYEGYEAGGVLTNNMRRKPYCVNVFDEAEKAHKDVFDIFLQLLDEGKVRDRRGIEASFANSINILTSNIGAQFFLDENMSFDEAKEKALKDLWDPNVGGFRPEFLNRFTGIFCFNRLGQPEIVMISKKALKELNSWVAGQGLSVQISEQDIAEMCKDKYIPKAGGRGIMNYIERNVTSDVADTLLVNPGQKGVVKVVYDKEKKAAISTFVPEEETPSLSANENLPVAKPASPAFNRK